MRNVVDIIFQDDLIQYITTRQHRLEHWLGYVDADEHSLF